VCWCAPVIDNGSDRVSWFVYFNLCLEEGWLGFFLGEVFCLVFGDDQIAVLYVCGDELLVLVGGVLWEFLKIVVVKEVMHFFCYSRLCI
jgi:hypothetical protein